MPLVTDNPYTAPQALPEQRGDSLWRSLIYRMGIGILVGVTVYVIVQFFDDSERHSRGLILLCCCVIVAASSTFTQSVSAKKSGRTGIIAAMMLWIASIFVTTWLAHAFGFTRPHLRGGEPESPQDVPQELIIWGVVYFVLVSGYFFLCCRKQNEFPNSNDEGISV